jgi:beta-glucanase (GH16 family)
MSDNQNSPPVRAVANVMCCMEKTMKNMKSVLERVILPAAFLVAASAIAPCGSADEVAATTSPNHLKAAGWEMVWSDEFEADKLDDAKWELCKRGKADWMNTMSDDPRLLRIEDGGLHLRGIVNDKKDNDPAPYLTAGVTSKGKYAFRHGKVQIRARFKSAQGAWPALWMLGAEKGWPANGEIDLMEHLNFDRKVYQTVHSEYTVKIDKTNTPKKGGTAPINRDDWNTYGCEWDADKMVFTVNGQPTHTYSRMPEKGEKQWPFNQPFYFILSMQIGGKWVNGSGPTNPAHYPAGMKVDWVHVYSRKTASGGTSGTSDFENGK